MGRHLIKMNRKKLEYLIENYSTKPDLRLAKELKIDRGTLFYWVDKLREHGLRLTKKSKLQGFRSSSELIGKIKKKLGDKEGVSRDFGRIKCGRNKNLSTSRPQKKGTY